ncbi:MAG: sigma-70 family RNA polymerase sigma factor [Clostridiales bacterium]|nr:sigma-70 family RNA polymerase sigma factor [Clostridiales bacterium]
MFLITLSTDNDNADSDKIERLYHKYYRLMYYVANKILQDNYLAEDAVQTAFLKLIPNLHKIEDINSHKTKAFVVIVVENVAKRMYTKRRKINTMALEELEYQISDNSNELEALISDLDLESIVEHMKKLHKNDSEILLLRYVHEMTSKEIAQLLDVKDAVVRKRLERARNRLAVLLEGSGYCEEK